MFSLLLQDNVTTIFDGICGDMNCRAGTVFSNGAEILHPAINDKRRAGPGTCGADYLGEPVFECNDGNTTVLTVNLIRQPRIPGVDNVSEIGSEYNFTEDGRIAFAPLVSMVDVSGTILGSRKGGRLLVHCCLCRIIGY
eukprot:g12496.t1